MLRMYNKSNSKQKINLMKKLRKIAKMLNSKKFKEKKNNNFI